MATYVGEKYRISSVPTDFDHETVLTPDMVTGVRVSIWNPSAVLIVDDAGMSWNAELGFWFYLWDTEGGTSGTHKIKVTVTDLVGDENFEWMKYRLARDPVPVAP